MYECTVLWSGRYYQHWQNSLHTHSYSQVISVLKGTGTIQIGCDCYALSEHSIFFIPPYVPHATTVSNADSPPQLMDVKFSVAPGALSDAICKLPAQLDPSLFSQFQHYFERILKESEENLPYSYDRICMYFGLTLTTFLRHGHSACLPEPPPYLDDLSVQEINGVDMRKVTQYIQQNYAVPISLEDLAKIAIVSKSKLILAFKDAYNTTPIKFINQVRLEKAKSLLLNSASSIGEISEMVGFQSLHYFSRYFKSREALSPVEYRQRYSKNYYFTYRIPVQSDTNDL